MADKNINSATVVSSLNNTDYLHLTTGNSFAHVAVSTLIAKAKADTLTQVDANLLDKLTDNCFIMYHRAVESTDNNPIARKASEWTARQNAGEVADGVLLICGDKHLVVAPTESQEMHWSSVATPTSDPAITGVYISDRVAAMNDFDGKDKTAAIIGSSLLGGDGTGYAPGFCNAYSRSNQNGVGLTAGKWWLPSCGEMMMLWANWMKINLCLSLISGATLLNNILWFSTERSATSAWSLNLSGGLLHAYGKVTNARYARPVSAFIN